MSKNKDEVGITRINKRGEWYTIEGVSGGKKVSIEIPASTIDTMPEKKARDLMKRSIYGQSQVEDRGRGGE